LKRQNFLHELAGKRKIQLIKPSDDVKEAYLKKSGSYLASAKLLRDNEHYEEAVSMAYYSMYYVVLALFFRTGIKCENHSAGVIILEEVFGIDTTALSTAKKERIDTQYYVDTVATKQDVDDMIRNAEVFHAYLLDTIARLSSETIPKYRKRLKVLIQ